MPIKLKKNTPPPAPPPPTTYSLTGLSLQELAYLRSAIQNLQEIAARWLYEFSPEQTSFYRRIMGVLQHPDHAEEESES